MRLLMYLHSMWVCAQTVKYSISVQHTCTQGFSVIYHIFLVGDLLVRWVTFWFAQGWASKIEDHCLRKRGSLCLIHTGRDNIESNQDKVMEMARNNTSFSVLSR